MSIDLHSLSTEQLHKLNNEICSLIRHRRRTASDSMRHELSLGDTVKFTGRRGKTIIGRVEKIMRTRCIVKCLDGTRWKCQMATLEHA